MKPYQVGKGVPRQTRADVDGRVFDADSQLSPDYRQYLRGGDITRFVVAPIQTRFIKYGRWLAEPRQSAGFDEPIKILMRQTGDSLVAAIDRGRHLCMNNMHVLVPRAPHEEDHVHFCVGLLNSRLMNWYYQSLNPEAGEALAEVKKTNIDRLPLPVTSAAQVKRIAGLSRRMEDHLVAHEAARDEVSRTVARGVLNGLVGKLNAEVYDLYDLDDSQRKIVDADQSDHAI